MAVQAQHPSIAFRVHNNVLEKFQDLQYGVGVGENQSSSSSSSKMILLGRSNCTTNNDYGHDQVIKNGTTTTVFSDMESELTCNINVVSASRKRKHTTYNYITTRSDDQILLHHLNPQQHNYFPSSKSTKLPPKSVEDDNRLNQSGGASTSGRYDSGGHVDVDVDVDVDLDLISPQLPLHYYYYYYYSQQYIMNSYYQNLDDEIDALIRLQHETLQSVVEQTQQRQSRLMLSFLEQQVVRRLKDKHIELEYAWGRKAELEQKIKQMTAENQMWFNVAKNNEATVLSLRSTLEQHLLNLHHQKTIMIMMEGGGLLEEGFGDSSNAVAADDAQSANYNNNNCHQQQQQVNVGERAHNKTVGINVDVGDHHNCDDYDHDSSVMMKHQKKTKQQQQQRNVCKVCKEKEVSVLLLPCRHLCLCKDCEGKLQTCPICNSFKNASLQIFMS